MKGALSNPATHFLYLLCTLLIFILRPLEPATILRLLLLLLPILLILRWMRLKERKLRPKAARKAEVGAKLAKETTRPRCNKELK